MLRYVTRLCCQDISHAFQIDEVKIRQRNVLPSFGRLSKKTEVVGYPVLPLVRELTENVVEEMVKYIH